MKDTLVNVNMIIFLHQSVPTRPGSEWVFRCSLNSQGETVWTDHKLEPIMLAIKTKNPCKCKSYLWCSPTFLPMFKSILVWGWCGEKTGSSGLCDHGDEQSRKCKLLSWLFRVLVQLLRRWEVFTSDVQVAFYPTLLDPKRHTRNRHASCCHSEQAWNANHLLSRNKVQLHRAFVVIPLFYRFPPPDNIQQNELRVIGVWGRAKQNKTKGHRWQRYTITAKAGECGNILGLPGFMWSLHCKLKTKQKS